MCWPRNRPQPMPTPAPIQPRQPDLARASRKPNKKELVDPEEVAGVEYGTTAKTDPRGTAAKTGTDALKIPLNPGNETGSDSGGINV